jgi:hypothetical protein
MNRQRQVLRVLSSICVGIMAFCVSFFLAFLLGAILIGSPEGYAFFSPQEGILFLVSAIVGLVTATFIGRNYFLYLRNSNQ